MSDASALAKESAKSLGAGAYLVTVLPSAVLVLTVFALFTSDLYPWERPTAADPAPGPEAVVASARGLGVAGGIVLLVTVLVVAVLLRPFQVTLVQVLEGYWSHRGPGLVETLAIEHHQRRRSRFSARLHPNRRLAAGRTFSEVAAASRRTQRADRMRDRAAAVVGGYPRDPAVVMPTLLGNVLRRAETTAGERYGLGTVVTYPRLYPHLSPRLDAEVNEQLDVLDTTATFTLLLWALTAATAPLLLRFDGWSLVPAGLGVLAVLTYRGSRIAADRYGMLLATAYDLHRFEMVQTLRRPLPVDPQLEREANEQLTALLQDKVGSAELSDAGWRYAHLLPPATTGSVSAPAEPRDSAVGYSAAEEADSPAEPERVDDHGA